ncbi:hypothetical protein EV426DRAFT_607045, partial [Tirmania nivea]
MHWGGMQFGSLGFNLVLVTLYPVAIISSRRQTCCRCSRAHCRQDTPPKSHAGVCSLLHMLMNKPRHFLSASEPSRRAA